MTQRGLSNDIKNIVLAGAMLGITYMAYDLYKQETNKDQEQGITVNITGDKNDVLNNSNNNYKPTRRHNNGGYKPNTPRQTQPEYKDNTNNSSEYRGKIDESKPESKTLEGMVNDTIPNTESQETKNIEGNVNESYRQDNYAINGNVTITKNVTKIKTRGRDEECNKFKKEETTTTYDITGIEKINANGQDYVIAMIDGIEGNNKKNKEKPAKEPKTQRVILTRDMYNAYQANELQIMAMNGGFGMSYRGSNIPFAYNPYGNMFMPNMSPFVNTFMPVGVVNHRMRAGANGWGPYGNGWAGY